MRKYKFLIVGSGLFGSVFAYKAKQADKKVLIIDKKNHLAGNCYTEKIEDINVHKYGPHIFHTSDKNVWNFINQFSDFNNFILSPIANYHGEIYNLPFNMNTFSKMWNITKPEEAQKIIDQQKAKYNIKNPKNLEEQALSLVGEDIYLKLIKEYTEKQWGRSAKKLPAFIISRLPVRFIYDNNYFNDRYQGIPIGGYTQMVKRMTDGIEIVLEKDFYQNKSELLELADQVIFTGKIDEYFNYCFGKLEYRSLNFETKVLNINNYQGNAIINYTSSDVSFTRVVEHKHFEFGQQEKTVITKEFPQEWNDQKEAYYPINDEKNNQLYQRYLDLSLQQSKIIFGGRLGEYKYYNMDQVIKSALELARKIL